MLYIEATNVLQFLQRDWKVSGIQRVTLEVIRRLHRDLGSENVRLLSFDPATHGLSCAPVGTLEDIISSQSDIKVRQRAKKSWTDQWNKIAATSNDTLLLIEGMGWENNYQAYERLKANTGVRVYQIVHDIIPIARPEFCGKEHAASFARALPIAMRISDEILAVSEFTKQDLLKRCASMIPAKTRVRVWPLAHEFPLAHDESPVLPESVKGKFVLSVGTIEDRKNQYRTVQAWRKLAKKYGTELPQLVLVGRYGIFTSQLIRLYLRVIIEKLGSKRVVVLNRCSDEILRALYSHCQFSVYISSYEGWGLPVGESLWCGKPVLSARLTSLPEVGDNLVDYIDPNDKEALMGAIEKLAFNTPYRNSRAQLINQTKLRDWDEVSRNLIDLIYAN